MSVTTTPGAEPLVARTDLEGGAIVRLTLQGGKGNVITMALSAALDAALGTLEHEKRLRAVILGAQGNHFSFGASVEEHLPGKAGQMLAGFHSVVRRLLRFPVPVIAAVRGQCLGGGMELALACSRIIASPDAKMGQPEIKLAVFAPAASVLLPARVGPAAAEELLVTGRTVAATEALALHLVEELADDPAARAEAWAREHLMSLSPRALRRAFMAARDFHATDLSLRLGDLEELYLNEVLPAPEANEGLAAFLEKRPPRYPDA